MVDEPNPKLEAGSKPANALEQELFDTVYGVAMEARKLGMTPHDAALALAAVAANMAVQAYAADPATGLQTKQKIADQIDFVWSELMPQVVKRMS